MSEAAVTTSAPVYPAFVNFTRKDDGSVVLSVRGEPVPVDGSHVCGFAADRGKPGRCVPGDDTCNNYCNMAPQRGPMADKPLPCSFVREGERLSLTLTADEFEALRTSIDELPRP